MSDGTQKESSEIDGQQHSTPPQPGQAATTAELFAGDDVPEYLRGKNRAEGLAWVDTLVQGVRQMYAQQQAQPAPAQPQQKAPVQQDFVNVDPELLLTEPKAWQQNFEARVAQYVNAQLGNAATPVLQQLNDTLEAQAKTDPANADVAEKYWPEVTQLVSQVHPTQRSARLYKEAVKLVRGNRFEELAGQRAQKLAAAATGIEGVSGSGHVGGADPQAEVWQKIEASELGKRQLATSGKEGFRKAVAAMGETLESYAEKLSKTATTFDPNKPGAWQTQLVKGGR